MVTARGGRYSMAVASLHIVDGGTQVKQVNGDVNNHSCNGSRTFKKDNLAALALVAPPPAGWQRVGKELECVGAGIGPIRLGC